MNYSKTRIYKAGLIVNSGYGNSLQLFKLIITLPRQNITSLGHNSTHGKPCAVIQAPNIFQMFGILITRVRIHPIILTHSEINFR